MHLFCAQLSMLSSGGEFKMVWGGTSNSSSSIMGSLRLPCAEEQDAASSPAASMLFLPQQLLHTSSSPGLSIPEVNCSTSLRPLGSFHGGGQQESGMPDQSWRQLLLGGLVGDHEEYSTATALLSKGLDHEGGSMPHEAAVSAYDFYGHGAAAGGGGGEEIQASPEATSCKSQLSQMLMAASSPRSCVSTSGLGSNMMPMEFSNTAAAPAPELTRKHHGQSDNSSECNSTETGSALKKARVQASSSAQSTLKVRKERLGDRITALHQIVSPFGKTDTASVLQETIGYIRFLLGQIEALSYPYLGQCCSANPMQQQTGIIAGERSSDGLLPEFPGQDAEKDGKKRQAKDLRSRGLCLVPVSCMPHLAADNDVVVGSDFWAAAAAAGGGGAPPLASMNLR